MESSRSTIQLKRLKIALYDDLMHKYLMVMDILDDESKDTKLKEIETVLESIKEDIGTIEEELRTVESDTVDLDEDERRQMKLALSSIESTLKLKLEDFQALRVAMGPSYDEVREYLLGCPGFARDTGMNLPKECDFCGTPLTMKDQVALVDSATAQKLELEGILTRPPTPPRYQPPDGERQYVACMDCLPPDEAQKVRTSLESGSFTADDVRAVPSMADLTRTIRQNKSFPESWSSAVHAVCASCMMLGDSEPLVKFFMSNAQEFMKLLENHSLDPGVERDFKAIWSSLEGPPAIEASIMSVALLVHKSL